jgi:hypothetical protein
MRNALLVAVNPAGRSPNDGKGDAEMVLAAKMGVDQMTIVPVLLNLVGPSLGMC